MCFTGEMSAGFAAMGLFATYWIYTKTENTELASGTSEAIVAIGEVHFCIVAYLYRL
jgi:hypothetical protein